MINSHNKQQNNDNVSGWLYFHSHVTHQVQLQSYVLIISTLLLATNYNVDKQRRISKGRVKPSQKVIDNNIKTLKSAQVKGSAAIVAALRNIEEDETATEVSTFAKDGASNDDDNERASIESNERASIESNTMKKMDKTTTEEDDAVTEVSPFAKDSEIKPRNERKRKRSGWSDYMKNAEAEGIVDISKSFSNKKEGMHPYGLSVKCLLCNTAVFLRRQFYDGWWKDHEKTKKHTKELQAKKDMRASGQGSQPMIDSFHTAAPKKKQKTTNNQTANKNITRFKEINTNCVGIHNAKKGKFKKEVEMVLTHIKISEQSRYQLGYYAGAHALASKLCTKKGSKMHPDGGLVCEYCLEMRNSAGSTNPSTFLKHNYLHIKTIFSRQNRSHLNEIDHQQIANCTKQRKSRCADAGAELLDSVFAMHSYLKRMKKLKETIPKGLTPSDNLETPNAPQFLKDCAMICKNSKEWSNSILMSIVKAAVTMCKSSRNKIKMEPEVIDFFRLMETLSPRACEFLKSNFKISPFKRHMRELNSKEDRSTPFMCDINSIVEHMEIEINCRLTIEKELVFTLAIDATKVAGCLQINSKHKAICGGASPNHWIPAHHLNVNEMKQVLQQEPEAKIKAEIAAEVKMCVLVVQNCPSNVCPFAVVACRPQSNNEKSDFTRECCHAAKMISDKYSHINFAGLSTDGMSLETNDLVEVQLGFMDGKHNHTAGAYNKHNIKNDQYHLALGGNSTAIVGNCIIDGDLLRQSGISNDLICPKDFTSDKKVEELFSRETMKQVFNSLAAGTAISSIGDIAALFATAYWAKLHLFLVNVREMPAVQRCIYLCLTLVWITSIAGMHDAPKRNILLESTSNMFLVLNSLIASLRDCSSEPAEHNFGMLRQRVREFAICQLVGLLDSVKRRNAIMHKHN